MRSILWLIHNASPFERTCVSFSPLSSGVLCSVDRIPRNIAPTHMYQDIVLMIFRVTSGPWWVVFAHVPCGSSDKFLWYVGEPYSYLSPPGLPGVIVVWRCAKYLNVSCIRDVHHILSSIPPSSVDVLVFIFAPEARLRRFSISSMFCMSVVVVRGLRHQHTLLLEFSSFPLQGTC